MDKMKKPYLTQSERQMIASNTLVGDFNMLRFRIRQLESEVFRNIKRIVK